jgi:hypothetical protein
MSKLDVRLEVPISHKVKSFILLHKPVAQILTRDAAAQARARRK